MKPVVFAQRAEELLGDPRVSGLFGCWLSASRKAVMAVVEPHGSVLWHPLCTEGLEQSANILSTNTCLNQQIEPGVRWAMTHGAQRCQVMDSDDMYPRLRELIQATMRYLPYENEQVAVESKADIDLDKPTTMDIAFPPNLAATLRCAADIGDIGRCRDVIEQIRTNAPQLADLLLRLARTYDDDIKETLLLRSDANE